MNMIEQGGYGEGVTDFKAKDVDIAGELTDADKARLDKEVAVDTVMMDILNEKHRLLFDQYELRISVAEALGKPEVIEQVRQERRNFIAEKFPEQKKMLDAVSEALIQKISGPLEYCHDRDQLADHVNGLGVHLDRPNEELEALAIIMGKETTTLYEAPEGEKDPVREHKAILVGKYGDNSVYLLAHPRNSFASVAVVTPAKLAKMEALGEQLQPSSAHDRRRGLYLASEAAA